MTETRGSIYVAPVLRRGREPERHGSRPREEVVNSEAVTARG
ncbi:hypothetical protein SLNWT_6983 [Streptomyces albus]|uniref:Uncharacterized protein n=1 Tax=Streptomyces albus (strain ATCC 21838 / DSM 41398 / FERM P-419 / JCM 4703 / NBRC 107858) TaxID=1081613 RepID=A0A0B5EZW8_STRA4|nr:hypothetical protein SLNWT_6983 [Streptomyces albus]AOU81662.1 hypothetical protein SLNHY_6971 [Streptomyces albus]